MKAPANIRMLILDIDGVLTDGRIYLLPDGAEIKVFNTLDGHGIKMLQRAGIIVAVITGRDSPAARARMKQLGIERVFAGVADKSIAFEQLLAETGIPASDCAYMGDDLPDLPVMIRVGLAATPGDAHESVRAAADFVSAFPGGRGAVRELCDLILSDKLSELGYKVFSA